MKKSYKDNILVGISVSNKNDLEKFLKEIKKYNIKKCGLFFEEVSFALRQELYTLLLDSNIKEIPLVHIYNDYKKQELLFFMKKFKTKFFTIHESDFNYLDNWKGLNKKLFLEMNFDDHVANNVRLEKIGGFCIDLSHFKVAKTSMTKEYYFIMERIKSPCFKCNHINGYSKKENIDMHDIESLKDFDYLIDLPKEIFGEVIAIEAHNSIKEQIRFIDYIIKILNKRDK